MPRDHGVGSDQPISITDNDPLFQTQRQGIERIDFDLAPGNYRINFLFAELEKKEIGERIFSIMINGKTLLPNIDLMKQHGRFQAVEKSADIYLDSPDLIIEFLPKAGEAVLNGIQISRQ